MSRLVSVVFAKSVLMVSSMMVKIAMEVAAATDSRTPVLNILKLLDSEMAYCSILHTLGVGKCDFFFYIKRMCAR